MHESNSTFPRQCTVVVIGGGNADICAALSAAKSGAQVLVLERAPRDKARGNNIHSMSINDPSNT
jgi:tricarballylate dehydrogenase